jgi:threonine dehydratase
MNAEVPGGGTVAEGIAVKSPGALTMDLINKHVDDVVLVNEEFVERAIFNLLEIEKTLVEGAGAAGLAAVLRYPDRFRNRRVGLPLCGGNIDMMILSSLLQRGLVRSHRLVRLRVEIETFPRARPFDATLGELDSNIIDIAHQRTFGGSSVRAAVVDLTLQMRGEEQEDQVVKALKDRGLDARIDDGDDRND